MFCFVHTVISLLDGKTLLIYEDFDEKIHVTNMETNECYCTIPNDNQDQYVNTISISPTGSMIVLGMDDGKIIIKKLDMSTYGVDTGGNTIIFEHAQDRPITCVVISTDERFIVSGGNDQIKIWEIGDDGHYGCKLTLQMDMVNSLAITSDGSSIVSTSSFGNICVWDTALPGGKLIIVRQHNYTHFIGAILTNDDRHVVYIVNNILHMLDINTGMCTYTQNNITKETIRSFTLLQQNFDQFYTFQTILYTHNSTKNPTKNSIKKLQKHTILHIKKYAGNYVGNYI